MGRVHNASTIARIIVRELRAGNTYKVPQIVVCQTCGWSGSRITNVAKACPRCMSGRIKNFGAARLKDKDHE